MQFAMMKGYVTLMGAFQSKCFTVFVKLTFIFLQFDRGLMNFQHVNPQEAVEIHQDVNSNMSIGIHWGTFNLSYEVCNIYLGVLKNFRVGVFCWVNPTLPYTSF